MTTISPARLLVTVLLVDAVVSGAVALLQLALPGLLGQWLRLPSPLLWYSGLFLCGYVAVLVAMARARRLPSALVAFIAIGNAGWALGCLAVIGWPSLSPSGLGIAYLLVQAVAVLAFAVGQAIGLRRSTPVTASGLAASH